MSRIRTAIVIGGGVAGPVTAIALRKAGIDATVHEAYDGPADGVGGSLSIAPNGLAALRAVGAEEPVIAIARPIVRTALTVGRKHLGNLPAPAGLPPMRQVWRADLHRALHDHAVAQGIRVEHGKRLVDVTETAAGITARFADGSTAGADILVGADGIRSTVRTLIDPDAPGPLPTGMLGFEAIAGHDVPGEPGTMTFAFGKRAYYLYWPASGGGTSWGVNLPQERPMTLTEAREIPAAEWLRTLRATYAGDDPGRALMESTSPDRLHVLGSLHIMPSLPHWYRGRMVLVGDSAHAPSNSSGQGAAQAIESAVQLARCLRDLPDADSGFAAYQRLRRPRVEKIAANAAKVNNTKTAGPVTRALLPVLMPIMLKTVMNPEKTQGPIQRHRIDWDAPVAARS